jgi:hypothetical protein
MERRLVMMIMILEWQNKQFIFADVIARSEALICVWPQQPVPRKAGWQSAI